jgi:hypothetical protein
MHLIDIIYINRNALSHCNKFLYYLHNITPIVYYTIIKPKWLQWKCIILCSTSLSANSASRVLHILWGLHTKIQIGLNDHAHLDVVMSDGHFLLGPCQQVSLANMILGRNSRNMDLASRVDDRMIIPPVLDPASEALVM